MNILIIDNKSFGFDDVISIFKRKGHNVFTYKHADISMHQNDTVFHELESIIQKNQISLVFSFNYFPIVSYVLKDTKIKYISYVYDSPNIAVFTCSIIFPCNYIFLFDHAVYEKLHNGGITTVFYLPLSVNIARINSLIETSTNSRKNIDLKPVSSLGEIPAHLQKNVSFEHEVSFVGSLYNEKHTLYNRLCAKFKPEHEHIHGYLDGIIDAQSHIYDYFFLEEMLDEKILRILDETYPYTPNSDSIATPAYVYAHYFMARKVTEIERKRLLGKVSEKFNLSLFTPKETPELPHAHNLGPIDYYDKMPLVFHKSKINLNITLKSILTGIPLRCIDIMASGGFLLTNYQADLFRHFEPGKHFDYYCDDNELLYKIDYYLNHEDERMCICENAKKETSRNFNLEDYLQMMIDVVEGK
ncbi:MAG: glycosyltransferase [Lachnospiraceae bacterium]|nr:glycosyltransferase [Lachnospiraceae bacterium]